MLSEKYIIPFSEDKLDFPGIFGNSAGVTLEIGFGSGLATAQIAQTHPEKNYLGVEVHRPGIGKLLWEIEKRSLANIRIIEYDAAAVAEKMIPENSLDAIHVFFPDPWPKKRHNKRRLIQNPFTHTLACRLKPGGYLYMVTDWEDYAVCALDALSSCPSLKNAYNGFAEPQSWRPKTKFEQKGLAKDHKISELFFIRGD
ncbi:tRNA (guanosine(46)-N7)-methyltransferase TrmB [Treponema sp. R6D11]